MCTQPSAHVTYLYTRGEKRNVERVGKRKEKNLTPHSCLPFCLLFFSSIFLCLGHRHIHSLLFFLPRHTYTYIKPTPKLIFTPKPLAPPPSPKFSLFTPQVRSKVLNRSIPTVSSLSDNRPRTLPPRSLPSLPSPRGFFLLSELSTPLIDKVGDSAVHVVTRERAFRWNIDQGNWFIKTALCLQQAP